MIFSEHFEWDDDKEASNRAKHGVTFLEAIAAFADPKRLILPDLGQTEKEPRWHRLGRVGDTILTVRFTRRAERVRIIGAGCWRKGKQLYEAQNQIR
ncbi:MAG: BrnT family toxin [Pedosphaera sp.]|nr:BrnT family toxin [Pedosphaera sp.]